jgi:hypothetical protein
MADEKRRLCAHADQDGRGMHWLEPGEECQQDGAPDIDIAKELKWERDVALEQRNFWKAAAEKSHQQLLGERHFLGKFRDDADTAKERVAVLEGALEPLRNDIIEAAETDTQWEDLAKAAGWLIADEGRGWYQADPVWHWIENGRAVCDRLSVSGVELIEKLATDSGGLACIDCVIHVMRPQPEGD